MKLSYIEIMGILAGVFAIGFGIYWFFFMRKNKAERAAKELKEAEKPAVTSETYTTIPEQDKLWESWDKKGENNAEIVDPKRRTIGRYHVNLLDGKDYGRQFLVDGFYLYSLRIDKDGVLQQMPHSIDMKHPTSELYEAVQTKEDMEEVIGNHDESGDKFKMVFLVVGACIALFLMFMAVYKGGK